MRGIYAITNTVTGAVYYGQSVGIRRRRADHFYNLRRGAHGNDRLQQAWDRHGADAFVFKVLYEMPFGDLDVWERACIDGRRMTGGKAYNRADPLRIEPVSAETRERMSRARSGKTMSPESCAKISAALRGRKKPPGFGLGHLVSEATRAKISASERGKYVSPETCAKLSAANRGQRKP